MQLWSFHSDFQISHHLAWPCSHTATNSEYSEFWSKKTKRFGWAHFNQIVVRHASCAMLHTTNIWVPYEIFESFLKIVSIGTEHRLFFYPIAFLNIPASSSRRNLSSRTKTRRKSAKILTQILHAFVMTQEFKVCSVRSGVWSIIVANCDQNPRGERRGGKENCDRESSSHDGFTFTGIVLLRVFNAVTKECGSGS
jgi:hypothetical protein